MFADAVRANRHRLGLTQEELATSAGLSVRTIRKIEAGLVKTPRPVTVRLLANAFGLAGADRERFCQAAADGLAGPLPAFAVPVQRPTTVSAFLGRAEQRPCFLVLVAGASDEDDYQRSQALVRAPIERPNLGAQVVYDMWLVDIETADPRVQIVRKRQQRDRADDVQVRDDSGGVGDHGR